MKRSTTLALSWTVLAVFVLTLAAPLPAAASSFEDALDRMKKENIGGSEEVTNKMIELVRQLFGLFGSNSKKTDAADKKSEEETCTVDVDTFLNFRTGPGTDHSIIERLHDGDKLTIIDRSGGWYKVKFGGKTGWVCAKYVRKSSSSSSTASKPKTTGSADTKPAADKTGGGKTTGGTPKGTGRSLSVKATGYFPPPAGGYKSQAEARMEGGAYDCRGKKLRTLQDYNKNDPKDYVSCATDPRVIKTGTYFTLDQFPGVRFLACDVGGAIKGNHIDICCKNEKETYKLPSKVTVRYL